MPASSSQRVFKNHLLASLAPADLALLAPQFELTQTRLGEVIETPHKPIEHIHFPESGLLSLIAIADHRRVETGMMGYEGMSGIPVVMGNDRSPNVTVVQIPGHSHVLKAADLRNALHASDSLRTALLHHAQAFMAQTSQTALANGCATIEQRLARWLLMAHDRSEGNSLPLTHEFISIMLSVRRSGVTVALHALETRHLIGSSRGAILVTNRLGLEHLAGEYYGVPEHEYFRLTRWRPEQHTAVRPAA
jgi:CRP-like cAMP-binding protein